MSDKNVNYTEEQTAELVKAYVEAKTEETRAEVVETFAEELGKTVRSIRAKLVREGVYVAKTYKSKTGAKPETKEAIVSAIADTLGVDADATLSGLEKATKNCLIFLRTTFDAVAKDAESESE